MVPIPPEKPYTRVKFTAILWWIDYQLFAGIIYQEFFICHVVADCCLILKWEYQVISTVIYAYVSWVHPYIKMGKKTWDYFFCTKWLYNSCRKMVKLHAWKSMMTSWHGNAFHITGFYWGESIVHWLIPIALDRQSWALIVSLVLAWTNCWTNFVFVDGSYTQWRFWDVSVMTCTQMKCRTTFMPIALIYMYGVQPLHHQRCVGMPQINHAE